MTTGSSTMATAFAEIDRGPESEGAVPSVPSAGEIAATPAETSTPAKEAKPAVSASARASKLADTLLWPIIGIVAFVGLWAVLAPQVDTSLGSLPGPAEVAEQGGALYEEWAAAKESE